MPQAVPPGWIQTDHALTRTVQRSDFVDALAFTVELGGLAENADHHPDIAIRGYRSVEISLSTHSAGNRVTEKDFALAQQINGLSEDAIRLTHNDLRRRFSA